jgi:hypothetical protein
VDHNSYVVRRNRGLFVIGIALLLSGGLGIYVGSHNYPVRALGVVSVMVSAYVLRISRFPNRSGSAEASGRQSDLKIGEGAGRLLWTISLGLVPLLGAALFLLHRDAANGGHEAWPADVFAGIALACAIVWGYLMAKIFGGRSSKN